MEEKNKKEAKEKRIKKEMNKIKKFYKKIPKEKLNKINDLIYRSAFLLVMAQDMENELLQCDSYIITTINASQTFSKTNPLCKDYRDTIKSYQAIIKQLEELTKDEINSDDSNDELDDFLSS